MLRVLQRSFSNARSFSTRALVVAEHDGTKLADSTLSSVTAAQQLSKNISVLVAGNACQSVADQASAINGVNDVILAQSEGLAHQSAENYVALLGALQAAKGYSHIVVGASVVGKNFLPRFAAKHDLQPITDVIAIKSDDTFVRPIYAGNALCTVQSKDKVKILSVRPTNFDKAITGSGKAPVSGFDAPTAGVSSKWIQDAVAKSERPQLASAKCVVSGGRALKSAENFKLLEELADTLGGAVGASRAAVDAGFAPNEMQVGQTGQVVAPNLYIAAGISGAIQHLAGMKDSKTIVAINKDPEAPIFQVADYGLVADLFVAVPELNAAIQKAKQ